MPVLLDIHGGHRQSSLYSDNRSTLWQFCKLGIYVILTVTLIYIMSIGGRIQINQPSGPLMCSVVSEHGAIEDLNPNPKPKVHTQTGT